MEYRIDARGCLYHEIDRMFRISRYQNKAVKSLTGMKSLDFYDNLTVEDELGFTENGQMNIKEEHSDARILARSPNWDEAVWELIKLNNKVYQVEWDYENGDGITQIQPLCF